jgi:hypothetical protein
VAGLASAAHRRYKPLLICVTVRAGGGDDHCAVSLGGVGAVYFGWLMDRYNANLVVAIGYLLMALAVYLVGKRRALCSSWRCSRRAL